MKEGKNGNKRISNKVCPEGMTIEEWQVALRREQAEFAQFEVLHLDQNRIWGDYSVANKQGACYRTAFRGVLSEKNYCSCLDFRTNGLGTCKHLEAVLLYLQKEVAGYPWAGIVYLPAYTSIFVNYKGGRSIVIRVGQDFASEYLALKERYFDENGVLPEENYHLLPNICEQAEAISVSFRCYDDVKDFVQERLNQKNWEAELAKVYPQSWIPFSDKCLDSELKKIATFLYNLTAQSNGLILSSDNRYIPFLISELFRTVHTFTHEHRQSYIVLSETTDILLWRKIFQYKDELKSLPISILSASEFIDLVDKGLDTVPFVYIDHAECLKEWKDTLSIAVKQISIAHLYLRVQTIEDLTPVQMSSILQHISPFILGPFYKFIHSSRTIFPLADSGQNLPETLKNIVAIAPDLQGLEPEDDNLRRKIFLDEKPEDKLKIVLKLLSELLNDEEGLALVQAHLSSLLSRIK